MDNALVIYGSHRDHGNTEILLNNVLYGMDKSQVNIEKVILKELNISPCRSCYSCGKTGVCSIDDDMAGLYGKLKGAGIIILASPIYFGSVSSVVKTMIDRCQAFWAAKYMAGVRDNAPKRKGYFIATSGSFDESQYESAKLTVKLFFSACDTVYAGELLYSGTDANEAKDNEQVIEKSIAFGKNICNL